MPVASNLLSAFKKSPGHCCNWLPILGSPQCHELSRSMQEKWEYFTLSVIKVIPWSKPFRSWMVWDVPEFHLDFLGSPLCLSFLFHLKYYVQHFWRGSVPMPYLPICVGVIHSKSVKICGVCFSVTQKSAEKVRKSRHENFASKVRKSIKSLKMHHLKAKCIKIWHKEHVNQRFWAF